MPVAQMERLYLKKEGMIYVCTVLLSAGDSYSSETRDL